MEKGLTSLGLVDRRSLHQVEHFLFKVDSWMIGLRLLSFPVLPQVSNRY